MMRLLRRKELDHTNIGSILVEMGLLTENQLDRIIEDFNSSKDELLGQFIVRKTAITEDQIEFARLKQKVTRGEGSQKVLDRLMEISQKSGQRVTSGLEELIDAANNAAGAV